MTETSGYARVAVPRPLYRTFLYRVPASLKPRVTPGSRVVVPFGRREVIGWVDEVLADPQPLPPRIRDVLDAPDSEPVLHPLMLDLCRWISRYYVAPLGLTFRAALPAALTTESSETLIRIPNAAGTLATAAERRLLAYLDEHAGAAKLATVRKALGAGAWMQAASSLARNGHIEMRHDLPVTKPPSRVRKILELTCGLESLKERDRIFGRARRQRELFEYIESVGGRAGLAHLARHLGISSSVVKGLVDRRLARTLDEEIDVDPFAKYSASEPPPSPLSPPPLPHTPTPAQSAAIERLLAAMGHSPPGVFVLKGVTGSGKTLVYIELLREAVTRRGRSAIVLVPEISLTPQTVSRFRSAFGDDVAVLHSALSDGERLTAWKALRAGEKRIVVGTRSAVFAPVQNLGIVILDEEHEASYKQRDPAPRYHAREVAVIRAQGADALCVLGSATPSLETWENARSGKWGLVELPERIGARDLPAVHVVDLREERKRPLDERAGGDGQAAQAGPVVLSARLQASLERRLEHREQSILLLNRRGYATFLQCRDCGTVSGCTRCNVSLTRHRRPPRLVCHYCNHQEPVPETCSACGSRRLSHGGVGTQQVERVLAEVFPDARIARMDVDTTSAKWSHHEILGRVERGEVDILLGTQMIAKGLDFPNVTLVGVINADVGLNLPDFRASERIFQLLTQVAGRAGRGPRGGEVIIQTALPGHYAIQFATSHDYEGFAERELGERSVPDYPPFTRLANVEFSGRAELAVQEQAEAAAIWLNGLIASHAIDGVTVLGPAPCPIDRVRGRWRWQVLLKGRAPGPLGQVLEYFARKFDASGSGQLRLEIDRDPISLL